MLAQEQKRTGGMFRKLKSETSALVAVPSSFARQFPGGLRLPASPLPDPVDAAAAGSKSLATGEWISALLSREGVNNPQCSCRDFFSERENILICSTIPYRYVVRIPCFVVSCRSYLLLILLFAAFTDSRNKDLQSIVQHVLNTDPTAVCFREGCKLTEEERTAIRGVLRTDTLHPPNYIGFSLTLHCEDVSVSLLTTNRHTVSELRLEGVHMRYAKLVSKAIELFGRLGKLDVIDRSQPSAAVSPTMWNELRHILSFTPSALDATSLSPDSTHVLQDLSLSSGFTSWRAVHPSLEYCRYMDLPALHAILRDDALCQLIVCGENITVASSAHTPLPQQTALGELIRFWKAAEQFSMLGSAYRSKTVVQGIFSTYFGVGTGGDGDAFVPTTAVRSALSGSDDRVLNELDVNITAILEGGADVPFSLFSGVQSAVECHLAVGPMLSFIQKHWCSLHGCFSAQCVSMGCSCPSALQAGGVQPVAPDPLSTVILFHVRHRYYQCQLLPALPVRMSKCPQGG